jgi:hypothetical protein
MFHLGSAFLTALLLGPTLLLADTPASRGALLGGPGVLPTLAGSADTSDEKAPRIVGKYDCTGTDLSGLKYTASVTIKKNGDAYLLEWESPDGQAFVGVGIVSDDKLAVSWLNQRVIGVMLYTIQKDGTLSGTWSVLGDRRGRVATEILTPKLT